MLTPTELFIVRCVAVFAILSVVAFWLLIVMFFATIIDYIQKKSR